MRTFEQIVEEVFSMMDTTEAESLLKLAAELDVFRTPLAEATQHHARGRACTIRGQKILALEHYSQALIRYKELGESNRVANLTNVIGIVHVNTGNSKLAIEHFHQALALHEELRNRAGVAVLTSNIGNVYKSTGNYPLALEHYTRALSMQQELRNIGGMADVTGNIGNVHNSTGNYPLALENYNRALDLYEELGDQAGVAHLKGNIGAVYGETGNHALALEHFNYALSKREDMGDLAGVAQVTNNIGIAHFSNGNYPEALENFDRALSLREELGDREGVAHIKGNIIVLLIATGSIDEALKLLSEMDAMQIDDPSVKIDRENSRAALQEHREDHDSAHATLLVALNIAEQHELVAKEAEVHKALRDLAQKRNDFAAYIEHNNEYTRITEDINGKAATQKIAMQESQRHIDAKDREHQKYMAVLHSTLPKHIADRVARGEVVTDHHDNAAVLFLDVVGFTNNASALPAGEVVELLQNIFTTFDSICTTHNVTKIKTIGDSYMAVAFPETDGSHTTNIARAAQGMMSARFTWSHNATQVQFRIGLHCGPVVAGVLGTQRMQYDVWGDTVNVASRMESSGEPGRIHVSGTFAELLGEFQIVPRGELEIKGKGMMTTYWLECANA